MATCHPIPHDLADRPVHKAFVLNSMDGGAYSDLKVLFAVQNHAELAYQNRLAQPLHECICARVEE